MIPQYRIEQYLNAINAAYLGDSPLPEYPAEPVWRIEVFLAAILSAAKGDGPVMACPDPVWHIEEFARAIYDALTGASPAWPCPTATNNIEAILHAIYKVVADGTETDGIATSWDIERWLLDSYDAAKEGGGGGTQTTVTGNLPLTLANALSKAIVSLTRYGLCTQDGIPTPDAPVDIMCNNGTLRMVDDELPSGYKRITGIKFDGDFWYDTGEALTGDDDVTMTLANTATGGQNVFGSYNGTSDGAKNFSLYIYGGGSSSNSYFRYGGQLLRPKFGSNERTITFGKSGTSGFTTDVTATPETFTTVAPAYIGMLPNSSSPAYTGSIIGSILVGTRLKWIPCERESDGVIGYYEAVNGAFLEPTGTGVPVAGSYDTSHFNRLAVVGTPEVLTVGGPNLLNTATNITGKYLDAGGKIKDGADAQYTDLIPVKAGETYVASFVSGRDSGTTRWHGYNENGTWVKQLTYVSASGQQGAKLSMRATIDSGISYVRLSYGIADTEAMVFPLPHTTQNWEGYYPVKKAIGGNVSIDTSIVIQSPYTAPAGSRGPAVLCEVEQGKIYYVVSTVTADNNFGMQATFYSSKDDATNASNGIGNTYLNKQVGAFEPVSGAAYAVISYTAAQGTTFTFDSNSIKVYYADADYQPYVPPQTASVPMLLSVGDVKDEVELIHGALTRRVTACLYDGTQPVGDVYMSTTGGKDIGAIIVYPLATPTTEQTTAQPLNTNEGTNVVDSVANVGPLTAEVTYKANA